MADSYKNLAKSLARDLARTPQVLPAIFQGRFLQDSFQMTLEDACKNTPSSTMADSYMVLARNLQRILRDSYNIPAVKYVYLQIYKYNINTIT